MSSKYDVPKINELQHKILLRALRYYALGLVEQLKAQGPIMGHNPANEYLEECFTLYKRLRDRPKGKPERFWWVTGYNQRLETIRIELLTDGAMGSLSVVADISALVASGDNVQLRFAVDSDNAGSVNYTTSFVIVLIYKMS